MEVGTLYPKMDEFKLVVRQFAINKEFDLGVEKSCKTRYRAFSSLVMKIVLALGG
jgi:hypothetical protein